jgi:hypothetical protein
MKVKSGLVYQGLLWPSMKTVHQKHCDNICIYLLQKEKKVELKRLKRNEKKNTSVQTFTMQLF